MRDHVFVLLMLLAFSSGIFTGLVISSDDEVNPDLSYSYDSFQDGVGMTEIYLEDGTGFVCYSVEFDRGYNGSEAYVLDCHSEYDDVPSKVLKEYHKEEIDPLEPRGGIDG